MSEHVRFRPKRSFAALLAVAALGAMASLAACTPVNNSPDFSPDDEARGLDLQQSGTGGYVIDSHGNLYSTGNAEDLTRPIGYFADRARGVALSGTAGSPDDGGYVLADDGTLTPFGAAPPASGNPSWPGQDMARDVDVLPSQTGGVVLDQAGGLTSFNGAVVNTAGAPSWPGGDRARGVSLLPDGSGGYVVNDVGDILPFGTARAVASGPSFASDRARGIRLRAVAEPRDGWVVDAEGTMHHFTIVSSTAAPSLSLTSVKSGLSIPWDVAFAPDGAMMWTERGGKLSARFNGTDRQLTADFTDLRVAGEAGLLGATVDPDFSGNRRIYLCLAQNSSAGAALDVRVVPFTINADWTVATRLAPLVTGIPISTGRHSGCRVRFGNNKALWIATGDASIGTTPQDLTSLGGKLLRVDRFTGEGLPGNPFEGSANADTRRIWNYGHRNMQGLTRRPDTNVMWTVEHGPGRDDEVNIGVPGNFGWDPVPGYTESVPMTDLVKFPDAVPAAWSSGSPTVATGGAAWLTGPQWRSYEGMLAVAELKNSSLRLFRFTQSGELVTQFVPAVLDNTQGRLRTAQMGPDGSLYLTTSNGSNDQILKLTPG